jgi:hypothetical protein
LKAPVVGLRCRSLASRLAGRTPRSYKGCVHPIERALSALDANLEALPRLIEELPADLQSALAELERRERRAVEELRRLA